jgi:hypothetical protein
LDEEIKGTGLHTDRLIVESNESTPTKLHLRFPFSLVTPAIAQVISSFIDIELAKIDSRFENEHTDETTKARLACDRDIYGQEYIRLRMIGHAKGVGKAVYVARRPDTWEVEPSVDNLLDLFFLLPQTLDEDGFGAEGFRETTDSIGKARTRCDEWELTAFLDGKLEKVSGAVHHKATDDQVAELQAIAADTRVRKPIEQLLKRKIELGRCVEVSGSQRFWIVVKGSECCFKGERQRSPAPVSHTSLSNCMVVNVTPDGSYLTCGRATCAKQRFPKFPDLLGTLQPHQKEVLFGVSAPEPYLANGRFGGQIAADDEADHARCLAFIHIKSHFPQIEDVEMGDVTKGETGGKVWFKVLVRTTLPGFPDARVTITAGNMKLKWTGASEESMGRMTVRTDSIGGEGRRSLQTLFPTASLYTEASNSETDVVRKGVQEHLAAWFPRTPPSELPVVRNVTFQEIDSGRFYTASLEEKFGHVNLIATIGPANIRLKWTGRSQSEIENSKRVIGSTLKGLFLAPTMGMEDVTGPADTEWSAAGLENPEGAESDSGLALVTTPAPQRIAAADHVVRWLAADPVKQLSLLRIAGSSFCPDGGKSLKIMHPRMDGSVCRGNSPSFKNYNGTKGDYGVFVDVEAQCCGLEPIDRDGKPIAGRTQIQKRFNQNIVQFIQNIVIYVNADPAEAGSTLSVDGRVVADALMKAPEFVGLWARVASKTPLAEGAKLLARWLESPGNCHFAKVFACFNAADTIAFVGDEKVSWWMFNRVKWIGCTSTDISTYISEDIVEPFLIELKSAMEVSDCDTFRQGSISLIKQQIDALGHSTHRFKVIDGIQGDRTIRKHAAWMSQLDAKRNLIAFNDGHVYDVLRNEVRKTRPDDLIQTTLGCEFDQEKLNDQTVIPELMQFLDEFFCGHTDERDYFLHRVAHAVFGCPEQSMWAGLGEGSNGKSTLIAFLAFVLGKYVCSRLSFFLWLIDFSRRRLLCQDRDQGVVVRTKPVRKRGNNRAECFEVSSHCIHV